MDVGAADKVTAILNTISEVVLAILPVLGVFRLEVVKHQRWSVISLLSLGFGVAIVGAVRTYYIFRIETSSDPTWYAVPSWIASEVEINLSLVRRCSLLHFIICGLEFMLIKYQTYRYVLVLRHCVQL
jgi:hypothetical protein